MWDQGYLDTAQMAGAFQLLRANDLVWSRLVRQYLLGERDAPDRPDGLECGRHPHAGADAQRVPEVAVPREPAVARPLRDRRPAGGDHRHPGADLRRGTERDHIAPWQSVYKIRLLSDTDVTFVLASGGHNAGIVSEPGHPRRRYRIMTMARTIPTSRPTSGRRRRPCREGSWWPAWQAWLAAAGGPLVAPPPQGAPAHGYPVLAAAPGSYVLEP